MDKLYPGDYIEILELNSSKQKRRKKGYIGEICFVDMDGRLYGTWGSFTVDLKIDKVKKLDDS